MARKERMARRTVRYHGSRMRLRELRGDRDRAFVMVHGIGVSSDYFEPLAYALHDHGDVLLLDLPGFGGIPRPKRPLTISGFADIVRAGIEEEGIEDPVLIGPPVNPAEPGVGQQAWRLIQSAAYESRRVRLLASRAYVRCGPAWFIEVLPSMMRYPMRDQLPQVQAQTLLLTGEHDTVVPAGWTEEMLTLLPHGRAEVIPGAAHNVVYEHSDQVAALTLEHLGLDPDSP